MDKILIIEDDKEISHMISQYLIKNGYDTFQANDGMTGLTLVKTYSPTLIILDIMLPYKSGDEVLKEIRLFSDVPVIIVSAKEMIQTKVDLLKLGADDYMTKPFDLAELHARIEVNIKRFSKFNPTSKILIYQDIELNVDFKEVTLNHALIPLTPKEFDILEMMMKNPQKVFSKQNLYQTVWNESYSYDDNTINTHMSNIRKKLKEHSDVDYIETVWGMGYKLA
ncbi:MAG: response regulator transcription factor [Turicibacter sp.]